MQTLDPYHMIEARLRGGEQPTLAEVLALLKADPVAAAVFRAGSWATILCIMQRVNGPWHQPTDTIATTTGDELTPMPECVSSHRT